MNCFKPFRLANGQWILSNFCLSYGPGCETLSVIGRLPSRFDEANSALPPASKN